MLSGENPYPPSGSDLSDGTNFVWPPLAVLVAAPLTLLPRMIRKAEKAPKTIATFQGQWSEEKRRRDRARKANGLLT